CGGALADDEAVAVAIERARRRRWRMVARRGRKEGGEPRRHGRAQLLGTAGDHDVLRAAADGFKGKADALAARGAGARGGQDTPGDPEEEPNIDRRRMAHHLDIARRG